MTAIKKLTIFLSLCLSLTIAANSANAKNSKDRRDSARRQIVGTWQLKQSSVNSEIEKVKAGRDETLLVAAPLPNSVTLAADDEFGEITINEGFEKVIHTQTLSLKDGVAGFSRSNGTQIKAFWQNKKLIVESSSVNGAKMTEIFELANKNQLKVTLRLEDAKMPKAIVTRRVYERAADDQSGGGETSADINISQFLL